MQIFGGSGQKPLVGADLEDAAGTGLERERGDLLIEGREKLLRHPGRPQQPTALGAVVNFDAIVYGG